MKFQRFLIFLSIALVAIIISISLYSIKIDFFTAIDLKLKDTKFKIRENIKPDKRVAIIAIDTKSVNELGRWPWDRKVMARLIDNLKAYGAKTVCLDIVFSETSTPESDKALSESIKKAGNVITGYFFRQEEEKQSDESLNLLKESRIKVLRVQDNVTEIPVIAFPTVETNIPIIARSSYASGFFNVIHDRDGIIRTANLLVLFDGDIYPSLPLTGLKNYLDKEIILDVALYGIAGLYTGEKKIPVDESGRLTLNYYGMQGSFKTIPAVDVIKNRLNPHSLKDMLVFVGPTETGIADVRATPLDPTLPGVEIHATLVSNILQNNFLYRNAFVIALEIIFICIFPIILAILFTFIKRIVTALAFFLATMGVYIFVDYILFKNMFLNTTVIYPILSMSITYLCSEAYKNLVEERHSRFLKKAFSSYVSPALVGQIIKNPDMLKLGGEKRKITVLFSDIRSFTTISERLTPEELVLLLNRYMGPMTDILLAKKGTLDKYIGDAIMAIYNAPITVEDHSIMACETALDMLDKLKEINEGFKKRGLIEIDIGIGINTGDAIVGNMGSDVRFDYTAIGDTVNLASRLEGMNKVYKTHAIVSEFTVEHIMELKDRENRGNRFLFRELDLIRVKGKEKPVKIYELLKEADKEMIDEFVAALNIYRQCKFQEAREIFKSIYERYKDPTSTVFIERCNEFIENPHPGEWDGVYVAKSK
ncbi:MAG: adenylate/guanylate cyclase domain-containing protein [Syntrophorhabdaceae bacterium]|nr:adenylate/guanylate cyclase domain-containing protein [Syntrophorhabdaceae bacterium]